MTFCAGLREKIDGARNVRARARAARRPAVALARRARTSFQIRVAIAAPGPRPRTQLSHAADEIRFFSNEEHRGSGDQRARRRTRARAQISATTGRLEAADVVRRHLLSFFGTTAPVAPRDDDVFDSSSVSAKTDAAWSIGGQHRHDPRLVAAHRLAHAQRRPAGVQQVLRVLEPGSTLRNASRSPHRWKCASRYSFCASRGSGLTPPPRVREETLAVVVARPARRGAPPQRAGGRRGDRVRGGRKRKNPPPPSRRARRVTSPVGNASPTGRLPPPRVSRVSSRVSCLFSSATPPASAVAHAT